MRPMLLTLAPGSMLSPSHRQREECLARGTRPSLVSLDVLLLAFWMGYHDQDGQARCTCISPRVKPPQSPVKSFRAWRQTSLPNAVQADKANAWD